MTQWKDHGHCHPMPPHEIPQARQIMTGHCTCVIDEWERRGLMLQAIQLCRENDCNNCLVQEAEGRQDMQHKKLKDDRHHWVQNFQHSNNLWEEETWDQVKGIEKQISSNWLQYVTRKSFNSRIQQSISYRMLHWTGATDLHPPPK